MFKDNPNFYPTPPLLIKKMVDLLDDGARHLDQYRMNRWLEPSAGAGDIVDYITENAYKPNGQYRDSSAWLRVPSHAKLDWMVMESDPDLQRILKGKGYPLLATDFLTYQGADKFDVIIANPPFDNGASHLLKAIDVMYRGQIVFLLNAETIRNPFSARRKLLKHKLEKPKASIEFIPDAFRSADRTTGVEVALVYLRIDKSVDDSLFDNLREAAKNKETEEIGDGREVSVGRDSIEELIAEYNQVTQTGLKMIAAYTRHHKKLSDFIGLRVLVSGQRDGTVFDDNKPIQSLSELSNDFLRVTRRAFWRKSLDLSAIRDRLTKERREEFEQQLEYCSSLDFTEENVRQFALNIIDGYKGSVDNAIQEVFGKLSMRHAYHEKLDNKNIHLFNGWKTNKAFKVNKKVIIPVRGSLSDSGFVDWGRWRLGWQASAEINDIDVVCSYFDGMRMDYRKLTDAITEEFNRIEKSPSYADYKGGGVKVESEYFHAVCYKKGTLHLTFKDEGILRRFNIEACKGKGWLPQDYGRKDYNDMPEDVKQIVQSFEGEKKYQKNLGKVGIDYSQQKLLGR